MMPPTVTDPVKSKPSLWGDGGALPPPPSSGGGDDWEKNPPGRRGPRERLQSYRVALGIGLVSIFTLFLGLMTAYLTRQSGGRMDPGSGRMISDWQPLVLPKLIWLNSAVLLTSSATLEVARRQLFYEPAVMAEWIGFDETTRKRSLPWILLSLALGLGFLAGQYVVWQQLQSQGVHAKGDPSGAFFYILTGTHALHLSGGLLALLWCAVATVAGAQVAKRQVLVDVTAWYWHAMGVLWVGIFLLLWLARG